MKENSTKIIKKILFLLLFLLLFGWILVLCFYHLGEAGTQNWDEARHVANAYEMMKTGSWWIHTYMWEPDYYNFKPPLSMWCIIGSFKLLGISSFSMRFYSAVSMLLIFLLLFRFTMRNFGRRVAIIFGMIFASGTDLFFFHMARSADADALYLLMFTAAMVCLYVAEKEPWFLTGTGIFLSLAFMAKCFHVAIGIAVLICYLPRLYKKLKLKHYLGAIIGGIIPTGIWAVIRFSYDGFAFFAGMFGQEVADRVEEGNDYFAYLRYFGTNPVVIATLIALIVGIVLLRKKGEKTSIKAAFLRVIGHRLYLFVLWLVIPLAVYSLSGAFMEWYGYICYLPFCVIVGAVLGKASELKGKKGYVAILLGMVPLVCLGISGKQSWENLQTLRYTCNTDIRQDLNSLIEEHPEYRGATIYIENSRNEYQPQNVWDQNCLVDAYIAGDLRPTDGGVPMFLEDKEAILIISKDLFESYSSSLVGRVILVDGTDYLIFNNEFYG